MKHILLLSSILISISLSAQTFRGKLIDMQNQPVSFANVITLTADSAFIAGTVSNDDGTFQVT